MTGREDMRMILGALATLALLVICGAQPRAEVRKIGVIVTNIPGDVSFDEQVRSFLSGLSSAPAKPSVLSTSAFTSGELVQKIREFLERDMVDMLVIGNIPPAAGVLAGWDSHQLKPTFYLGTPFPDVNKRLVDRHLAVVSYGPLPRAQQNYLIAVLGAADRVAVLSYTSLGPYLGDLVSAVRGRGANVEGFGLDPRNTDLESVVAKIVGERPAAIGGVLGEPVVEELSRRLTQSNYKGGVLFFSPPSILTRSYLAGRLIGLAIKGGAKNGDDVLASIRKAPRFSADTAAVELPWSMHFGDLSDAMQRAGGSSEFFGPDRSGTDNTEECSCKARSGEQVSCKSCAPGKCSRKDDGTDYCSTECTGG
jgi:hypothetical protein